MVLIYVFKNLKDVNNSWNQPLYIHVYRMVCSMFTAHTCPTHSYSAVFVGTSYRQFRRSHFLLESVKYTIPSCVISRAFRNFSGSPFTPVVGNKLSLIMEKIGQINVQLGFQILMNNFNMIMVFYKESCHPTILRTIYIYIFTYVTFFNILSFEIEKVLVKNDIKIMNEAVALLLETLLPRDAHGFVTTCRAVQQDLCIACFCVHLQKPPVGVQHNQGVGGVSCVDLHSFRSSTDWLKVKTTCHKPTHCLHAFNFLDISKASAAFSLNKNKHLV